MEWFILSRDLHVLCVPSSDSKDSLPIFNDKQTIVLQNNTVVSTYDFSVQQKHPDATNLKYGNYVVFRDKYDKARMYTLISHDGDDLTQTWHAEDIGLDLLNETADKWDYTGESHGIDWYFNNLVLKDTGWSIGINEISNLTRGLKFDGQSDTQLKRLGDIANQFDGAEIDFEVELDGSRVTKQVVNIYKKVGNPMTQQRFIDAVNLKSLQSSGSIEDLCTAMIGYGSQPDIKDGENAEDVPPIDFADLSYDDGQFFSPKGDKAVYDRLNHLVWSRYSGFDTTNQNETKGYITGIYNYETKDPNELLNRTITQLKKRNAPSETYEANLLDINADIGDEVQIAHNQYNPPIYLSARVESVTNCYTANGQDIGVLGDYRKLESDIDPRIKEMLNALENQIKSHYMWIRYAEDDKGKGMTSVPTVGTEYIAILANKKTAIPSDDPADYAGHWQLIKGSDGKDGIPGATGADGKTSYTHFAYANNVSGTTDFSLDDPTGRSYMGVYSDFTKADSTNPDDYIWSYTKGETGPEGMQGAQGPKGDIGIPGKPGADGKTSYTHVAYADNDEGSGFSQNPANKAYMGWYSDFTANDLTDPTKYAWSLIKGSDGLDGAQGIPGPKGDDGKTPYTHIAYANDANGGGFSQSPDNKKYVGMYVDFTENDSSDTNKYNWSLIKGEDGAPGKDGVAGKDGVGIKSTQIMYAQSTSGTTAPTTGWTAQVPTLIKGQYLWTQTTWVYTDSTGEAGYTVSYNAKDGNAGSDGRAGKDGVGIKTTAITYATSTSGTSAPTGSWVSTPPSATAGQFIWTRTIWTYTDNTTETGYSVGKIGEKGATGSTGANGIPGKPGANGKTPYFHTAWATSADGKNGFSITDSANKTYLGTYTDFTKPDSTDTTKYAWSLIKGRDGTNGTPGKPGANGKTPYFHQAWADSKDGKINFSATDPSNRGYLGTYTDYTQADSTDPSKYFWVELVGALSIGGRNYLADTNTSWQTRGSGSTNQTSAGKWQFTFGTIKQAPFNDGDYVTVSFDYISVGSGAYGTIMAQFNNIPWGGLGSGDAMKDIGHFVRTVQWKSVWTTNGTATGIQIRMDNVATTRTVTVYNMQFERGNKDTDHKVAPEDTQKQIDATNQGLLDTNSKINAVTKVDSQATAPTNPKKGDQWWVKDANGNINAFKIWDGTKWADSIIQQSAMNIDTLNGNTINGAVINGSKFTSNFSQEYTGNVKDGPLLEGVQTIGNGSYTVDYKVKGTKAQRGYTQIQPDGLVSYITDEDGNVQALGSLLQGSFYSMNKNGSGYLTPEDLVRTGPESWSNSDAGGTYTISFERRWGRVWITGEILLPTSAFRNYHTLFTIKTPGLRPQKNRWFVGMRTGSVPVAGEIEMRPNGEFVVIGVPQGGRHTFEGVSYSLGNE